MRLKKDALTMRVPRVRFTLSRMMVAVTIAAFAIGGWTGWLRYRAIESLSKQYQDRARGYSWSLVLDLGEASDMEEMAAQKISNPELWPRYSLEQLNDMAKSLRKRCDYKQAVVKKYEHAARYPWLPVAPDPADP
jgi:hypothetical protein